MSPIFCFWRLNMAKSVSNKLSKLYRFMCEREGNTSYHVDFSSKSEALVYLDELNDDKIMWYGLYEVDNVLNKIIPIECKRVRW